MQSSFTGPLETVILFSLAFWFFFYLANHAKITEKIRNALSPVFPNWIKGAATCALCSSFWVLAAFSLFTGFTPLLLWVPPATLFIDLTYQKLTENKTVIVTSVTTGGTTQSK